jgi:hypothetical protein
MPAYAPDPDENIGRFLPTPSFHWSRTFAQQYGCDLVVPNGPCLGDALVFTRLIEDLGRRRGRGLRILTSGLRLDYELPPDEERLAIWNNSPFVLEIEDADRHNPEIMKRARKEKDNFPQFEHVIRGIGAAYGVPVSATKPALYLTTNEMRRAMQTLAGYRRPLICLHRGGSIQPDTETLREHLWARVAELLNRDFGVFQLGRIEIDGPRPGPSMLNSSLREMFALVWAADGFVGFDSGPTHVAAAFDRPSVILWDAVGRTPVEHEKEPGFAFTNLTRWSYPQNENIVVFERFIDEALDRLEKSIRRLLPS